jgi:hypothetical protein
MNYVTQEIIRRARPHLEILRAGAVVSPQGALRLIAGRSGSGKTSRIAASIADGWRYAGDDFLFFSRSFERVYFLPICLLRRYAATICLQSVPCWRAEATMARHDLVVEVLRPYGHRGANSPAIELFSLFLRRPGCAFPFQACCEQLAGRAVWSAQVPHPREPDVQEFACSHPA